MPPKGGVSVHIARLAGLLEDEFDITLLDEAREFKPGVPNIRRMSPLQYLRIVNAAQVVHIHSFAGVLKLTHALTARLLRKRVVLTVHSVMNQGWLAHALLKASASLAHKVVAVNQVIADQIGSDSVVIPAYLPPLDAELQVSDALRRWVARQRQDGRYVVASNAYRLERYAGQDLYGLDLMIEAFKDPRLAERCACVFLLGAPEYDAELLNRYQAAVATAEMHDHFLIHTEAESFSGLVALSDATVRATNYDGDALSVRESLHFGKVSIASDAAARPEGTELFKSRDAASLRDAVVAAMQSSRKDVSRRNDQPDYRSEYRGLLAL